MLFQFSGVFEILKSEYIKFVKMNGHPINIEKHILQYGNKILFDHRKRFGFE